jgi:hypothetical protein
MRRSQRSGCALKEVSQHKGGAGGAGGAIRLGITRIRVSKL